MKYFCFTLTLFIGSVPLTTAHATDLEQGKLLYEKNCVGCHTSEIHTREKRIVNNFADLKERIGQCELGNNLTWFDEEIDAVTSYLNATYYKFEPE